MSRKPAKNYHQLRGRRHIGLSYPEKFGLTFKAVVSLVDSGLWRKFYHKWRYMHGKNLPKHECKMCGVPHMEEIQFVKINGDLICENCVKEIKEMARNEEIS